MKIYPNPALASKVLNSFNSQRVYAVLKDGEYVGKIVSHSTSSATSVAVWENTLGLVHTGKATGGGYDRFTSALAGCEFAGIRLYDHCEASDEKGYIPSGVARLEQLGYKVIQLV